MTSVETRGDCVEDLPAAPESIQVVRQASNLACRRMPATDPDSTTSSHPVYGILTIAIPASFSISWCYVHSPRLVSIVLHQSTPVTYNTLSHPLGRPVRLRAIPRTRVGNRYFNTRRTSTVLSRYLPRQLQIIPRSHRQKHKRKPSMVHRL